MITKFKLYKYICYIINMGNFVLELNKVMNLTYIALYDNIFLIWLLGNDSM